MSLKPHRFAICEGTNKYGLPQAPSLVSDPFPNKKTCEEALEKSGIPDGSIAVIFAAWGPYSMQRKLLAPEPATSTPAPQVKMESAKKVEPEEPLTQSAASGEDGEMSL